MATLAQTMSSTKVTVASTTQRARLTSPTSRSFRGRICVPHCACSSSEAGRSSGNRSENVLTWACTSASAAAIVTPGSSRPIVGYEKLPGDSRASSITNGSQTSISSSG